MSLSRAVRRMIVPQSPVRTDRNGWAARAPLEQFPWCVPIDAPETDEERARRFLDGVDPYVALAVT